MVAIKVPLPGRAHEILVAPGLLPQLPREMKARGMSGPVFVVTSPRIRRACLGEFAHAWAAEFPALHWMMVPEGEGSKSLEMAARLYTGMIRKHADRSALVVALGGGVIGDLAGFVASTFLRGVRLVQVPTTLLAQIDSSIGGKVGINHPLGKNLIGAFHQPSLVLADPKLLLSLPEREWHSGLFEAIKYGIIASPGLFSFMEEELNSLQRRETGAVTRLIVECAAIKARVVAKDEKESGLRMILNFGHTVGHALETVCGYGTLRHGEAVGWGMLFAVQYAQEARLVTPRAAKRMCGLIRSLGLPVLPRLLPADILAAMGHDKKRRGQVLRLVLPTRIGKVSVLEVEDINSIHAALHASGIVA